MRHDSATTGRKTRPTFTTWTIHGDRGRYNEISARNVTYKVKSINYDEIQLTMTSTMSGGEEDAPLHMVVLPGRRSRSCSTVRRAQGNVATITLDPLGAG